MYCILQYRLGVGNAMQVGNPPRSAALPKLGMGGSPGVWREVAGVTGVMD